MNVGPGGRVLLLFLIAGLYPEIAVAGDRAPTEEANPPANKLTIAYYHFSSGKIGMDINLRHTCKRATGWIGGYGENDAFDQARTGDEYDYQHDWLTLVPSVQAATHGFPIDSCARRAE